MKGKPGTKSEQARKNSMRDFGCIACHLDGKDEDERYAGTCEIHHMFGGNKKLGEWATVPLCEPHHTGPHLSWHKTRRKFRQKYGGDLALIETTNNTIGR